VDTNQESQSRRRRHHSSELKTQVLAECAQPGASVARVALAHGLNANLVHKWRRQAEARARDQTLTTAPSFIPVEIASAQSAGDTPQVIEFRLQRAGLKVCIRWPMMAAAMSAPWLRELLR
jgi:transposase